MKDAEYYQNSNKITYISTLLRSEVEMMIHNYFQERGYIFIVPPVLHEQVKNKKFEIYLPLYNDRYALNSSNALYLGAYAADFKKVYSISSCFRDESDSQNHLIEFRMLEVETVGMNFEHMIVQIENLISYILDNLLESAFVRSVEDLKNRIFLLRDNFKPKRIPYQEFIKTINKSKPGKQYGSIDISSVDYSISHMLKTPVFITDYSSKFATWTAKKKTQETSWALNLMLPDTYGELCEGCERTNDYKLLSYKISCAKVKHLQWYVEAVKKINSERSGYGIGIDRMIRWIVGAKDISSTLMFPRVKE